MATKKMNGVRTTDLINESANMYGVRQKMESMTSRWFADSDRDEHGLDFVDEIEQILPPGWELVRLVVDEHDTSFGFTFKAYSKLFTVSVTRDLFTYSINYANRCK